MNYRVTLSGFIIVFTFFFSTPSHSQFDFNDLNNDSFLMSVMQINDGNMDSEFSSEQIIFLKTIAAWLTVDTHYLMNRVNVYDEAINNTGYWESIFMGYMFIIEQSSSPVLLEESKVRNIILTKKLLDEKLSTHEPFIDFSKKLDYYYYRTYMKLDEFSALVDELLLEEIEDKIFLHQLISSKLFVLTEKGVHPLTDVIIEAKYNESPLEFHNIYLSYLFHSENYDDFLKLYSAYPINPFVRIQLAEIYLSYNDAPHAMQVVNDIISEIQRNTDNGVGEYAMYFEDFLNEMPSNYRLPSEKIMNYIDIYYNVGEKDKACFWYQYLSHNHFSNQFINRIPEVNYPYLIPEEYLHLYYKNIEEAKELNKKLYEYKVIYERKCQ